MPLIYTVLANLLMRVIGKLIREKGYNDVDNYARKRLQHATMKSKDETRNSCYDRSASNRDILSLRKD